jgi:deoxyadenosine/deoxycytidine kinase
MSRTSRIEICGGIATGKTTLAKVLARAGLEPILEEFRSNPFWRDFCANPSSCSFETEIVFLLQHYHATKSASSTSRRVCDFSFLLDRAYADLNLGGSRRSVFDEVYDEVVAEVGSPRVLVYLHCTPRTQLQRIKARGRREERSLSIGYIADVNAAVRRSMSRLNGNVRVLSLDSDLRNFANSKLCQRKVSAAVLALYNQLGRVKT